MENNNKSNMIIVDKTDVKHLINELRVVITQVLPELKKIENNFISLFSKIESSTKESRDFINSLDEQLRFMKNVYNTKKNHLTDTVSSLNSLEMTFSKGIKNFNNLCEEINSNRFLEEYMYQIKFNITSTGNSFLKSLKDNCLTLNQEINTDFDEINKSIDNKMRITFEKIDSEFSSLNAKINNEAINLNTKKIDCLNKTTLESLKKLNEYNDNIEKLYKKSFILIFASSFVLGGTVISALIWLIINKL